MSELHIVGLKCMLAASHAAPLVIYSMLMGQTDRRMDARQLHYAGQQILNSADDCIAVAERHSQ